MHWMGTIRIRVQTADKNFTVIHTTPVHQLTFCEAESCVKKKSIIKLFRTWNHHFWLKYLSLSTVHCFLQLKICLIWIRREICTDQAPFTFKNSPKLYIYFFMWEDNRGWTFSLEETLLRTHILARSSSLKLKHHNYGFDSYKHAAFHFARY